jgi:hypothetical protein
MKTNTLSEKEQLLLGLAFVGVIEKLGHNKAIVREIKDIAGRLEVADIVEEKLKDWEDYKRRNNIS